MTILVNLNHLKIGETPVTFSILVHVKLSHVADGIKLGIAGIVVASVNVPMLHSMYNTDHKRCFNKHVFTVKSVMTDYSSTWTMKTFSD